MKAASILILLFSVLRSNAQPVIDRSNYFEIGDSALLYFKFDTSLWSVDPGAAGENIIWDLSAVTIDHPSVIVDTLLFIDPVGTPFYPSSGAADYSVANICMLHETEPFFPENNDHNYYFASEDSLAFIGHWAATGGNETWEYHHPDPLRELVFPMTYGDEFTDQFTGYYVDQSGSGEHFFEGTITVTVDGWGTLITPEDEELNDVIRLRSVRTTTDSSALGVETYTLQKFSWFAADRKGAIVTMHMSINDTMQVETLHYQKQTDIGTSIESLPFETSLIMADDGNSLIISLNDGSRIRSVEIFNSAGQLVRSVTANSDRIEVDRTVFDQGIYMIQVYTKDRRKFSAKFLAE